jgi:hypothetical protein
MEVYKYYCLLSSYTLHFSPAKMIKNELYFKRGSLPNGLERTEASVAEPA